MIDRQRFNDAFSDLNDKYIARAMTPPPKPKAAWLKPLAAAIALIVAATPIVWLASNGFGLPHPPAETSGGLFPFASQPSTETTAENYESTSVRVPESTPIEISDITTPESTPVEIPESTPKITETTVAETTPEEPSSETAQTTTFETTQAETPPESTPKITETKPQSTPKETAEQTPPETAPIDSPVLENGVQLKYHDNRGIYSVMDGRNASGKVEIPEKYNGIPITIIGGNAFEDSAITELVLPEGILVIEDMAFADCASLTKLTIPSTVTTVGCYLLQNSTAPKTVYYNATEVEFVHVGISLFGENSNIVKMVIGDSVNYIPYYFCDNASELSEVVMGKNVHTIDAYAFANCTSLTSIDLPEGLRVINHHAFMNSSLTTLTLPSTLRYIQTYAFANMNLDMYELVIPHSIVELEYNVFTNAGRVDKLTYEASSISDIFIADNYGPFFGFNARTLYVNADTLPSRIFSGIRGLTDAEVNVTSGSIPSKAFYGCSELENVALSSSIKQIGQRAFENCESLTNIEGFENVTELSSYAFKNCSSLTEIDTSELESIGENCFNGTAVISLDLSNISEGGLSQRAFSNFSTLKDIILSPHITSIPAYAFKNSGIESIILPDGIKIIDSSAFENCTSLREVQFSSNLEVIGAYAFLGCTSLLKAELPEGLELIYTEAFKNCSSLESVNLPSSLSTMFNDVFTGCSSLKNVSFDMSPIDIPANTFKDCVSLESIVIPESVSYIGYGTFSGCSSLREVIISGDIDIRIGYYAFSDCKELADFDFSNVNEIEGYAFSGCTKLKSIDLSNVTELGSYAFSGCTALEHVILNDSLTIIYNGLFMNCTALTEISLPESISSIEPYAYMGCTGIKKLELSDNVTSIGASAFEGCTSLESLYLGRAISKMDARSFGGCTSLKSVYLPASFNSYAHQYNAKPIFEGCTGLIVYAEAETMPTNWGAGIGTSLLLGYSYEEYLEAIN